MKIYVSNLSFNINDSDLEQLFTSYGDVISAKIIMDRDTGRSRGFGFVEMLNKDEAIKAISKLNNSLVEGRALLVNEARPQVSKSSW